ncbi:MAG: hypothetical protein Q8P95_05245 [bacterium]|nr:hypothetical protein [bacterium]
MIEKLTKFFQGDERLISAKKLRAELELKEKAKRRLRPNDQTRLREARARVRVHIAKVVLACGVVVATAGVAVQSIITHHRRNTVPQFLDLEELLSPVEYDPDIDRDQIPTQLPALLAAYGEVTVPENYDPKKPNLYIIAQQHFSKNSTRNEDPEKDKQTIEVQADILKIAHLLHAMGSGTQFIEGIENGRQLTHTEPLKGSGVGEVPLE